MHEIVIILNFGKVNTKILHFERTCCPTCHSDVVEKNNLVFEKKLFEAANFSRGKTILLKEISSDTKLEPLKAQCPVDSARIKGERLFILFVHLAPDHVADFAFVDELLVHEVEKD